MYGMAYWTRMSCQEHPKGAGDYVPVYESLQTCLWNYIMLSFNLS